MLNKKIHLPGLERPQERDAIKKMDFPKEGGIKSYYRGWDKYPYPGYICRESAKTIEFIKRACRLIVDSFAPIKISYLFQVMLLKRTIQRFIPKFLNFAVWVIRDIKLKPELYSHSVREIHRLFNIIISREENLDMKDRWRNIRDLTCMVLEVDKSYRFRFQDILSEMNINEIKLDEADKYFTSFEGGYNYGGKKYES